MVYMKSNYALLLKKIDKHYSASKLEYKVMMLSKDIKVKIYRLKKIIDGESFFQTDEILRICEVLDVPKEEILKYFFNYK